MSSRSPSSASSKSDDYEDKYETPAQDATQAADTSYSYDESYTTGTHLNETSKTAEPLADTRGREASQITMSDSAASNDDSDGDDAADESAHANDNTNAQTPVKADAEEEDAVARDTTNTPPTTTKEDNQVALRSTEKTPSRKKREKKETYKGVAIKRPWVKISARAATDDTPRRPMEETLNELQAVKGTKLSPEAVAKQLEMVIELEAQALGCGAVRGDKVKVAGASRHLVARKLSKRYLQEEAGSEGDDEGSLPAVNGSSPPPGKKVFGCSERLYKLPKARQAPSTPPALTKGAVKRNVEDIVTRMYTEPLQKYTGHAKQLAAKYVNDTRPKRAITNDQKAETALRLVDAEMKKRDENLKKLQAKYASPRAIKRLDPDVQAASLQRLHNAGMDHQRDVMVKLKEKYVASTTVQYSTLTEEEWTATVTRLRGEP